MTVGLMRSASGSVDAGVASRLPITTALKVGSRSANAGAAPTSGSPTGAPLGTRTTLARRVWLGRSHRCTKVMIARRMSAAIGEVSSGQMERDVLAELPRTVEIDVDHPANADVNPDRHHRGEVDRAGR